MCYLKTIFLLCYIERRGAVVLLPVVGSGLRGSGEGCVVIGV